MEKEKILVVSYETDVLCLWISNGDTILQSELKTFKNQLLIPSSDPRFSDLLINGTYDSRDLFDEVFALEKQILINYEALFPNNLGEKNCFHLKDPKLISWKMIEMEVSL